MNKGGFQTDDDDALISLSDLSVYMTTLSLFVWLVNFANLFKRNEESSDKNQAIINRLACSVLDDKTLNALEFGMAVLHFSDEDADNEKLTGSEDDQ